ncbi:ATP-binding protein [Streptomyces sp. E2N166]|uniref:ATP-binding protein n=1 Tax=Streptomyces sp. E2N166 TaxID=1851909 RepID=UPI0012928E1D|nr:ATP-binding protein [Streptomyces sp. E2N166]
MLADWVIAHYRKLEGEGETEVKWHESQRGSHLDEIAGGARLLADLISDLAKAGGLPHQFVVRKPEWPEKIDWKETRLSHYFATLRPYPVTDNSETKVWRLHQKLGLKGYAEDPGHRSHYCRVRNDTPDVELVVLADVGLGYNKHSRHWPEAIKDHNRDPWIVVKLGAESSLDEEGGLWHELSHRRRKVIAITTADDLRRIGGIEISRGISWEQAAEDCAEMLRKEDSRVKKLAECQYVIVSFGPVGALIFARDDRLGGAYSLFFDPVRLEGAPDFKRNGTMWGYTSTLTASVAYWMMRFLTDPHNDSPGKFIKQGVIRGLEAMRMVYERGFGPVPSGEAENKARGQEVTSIAFPATEVTPVIYGADVTWPSGERPHFASAEVDLDPLDSWTILQKEHGDEIEELARRIVKDGIDQALADVPRLQYGDVITVDRQEIEGFQAVRSLVAQYARKRRRREEKVLSPLSPLSIAVFGEPGSGKSKTVKDVISKLDIPDVDEFKFREFNLSQFRDISDVADALHLLRDDRLGGVIPVVLWDEFDTSFDGDSLGWLRYFLSPMQDGTFQEEQAIHTIGRSIFVFAGGISSSLASFKDITNFKGAKGPDFLSRVRGTIELRGIDKQVGDGSYLVRRAIILRSILQGEMQMPDGGNLGKRIDPAVLNGFLKVSRFNHGVRSLKAIIENSSLSGEYYFGRSNLPSDSQLNLHVDAEEFSRAMRT